MDHEQLKELLPLEAMGRLEGEEAREMSAHLHAGCDECEGELRSFRETLAAMALTEAGEGPADRIWRKLEPRIMPAPLHPGARAARANNHRAARAIERAARPGVARGWRVATAVSVAALIVAAIIAGSFANQLNITQTENSAQLTALETQIHQLGDQLAQRDHELVSLRNQVAAAGELTRAVLAPDLRTIKLGPLPPAPDAAGLVAISASRDQSLLEVAGLPPAPADKAYELWWIGSKSGPVRAALFTPGPHGGAIVPTTMPPQGETILASAITLEPAGGVDKPTGAMYLKGAPQTKSQ